MQEYATPPRTGSQAQPEQRTTIRIEVAPDGLHITAEYVGTLGSIPAAVERLRAAGVLDLVKPAAQQPRKPAERVEPAYKPDGTACCPVHRKPLSEGRYGLFCSSKAQAGEQANDKGYCSLRFAE